MASKLEPIKPVPALIAVAITLIIWFVIPVPEGVSENAWQLLALFVGTIAAIIGKALPIGGVSIVAIALVAITGVTSPGDSKQALADALSGFSNDLIWLIGVAVMISISLKKTGLGSRIGYFLISLFGKRTLGIAYALSFAETILAPVTPSNTARGGGIIHPIMRSIASSFGSRADDGTAGKIGRYLALVNYNANPITSAMFVTATAPNPLVVTLVLAGTTAGITITWGMWALAALVPGIVALLVMPLVVYAIYPPEIKKTPDAPVFARKQLEELGPISKPEYITMGVFSILLFLWAGVPAMLFGEEFAVQPTAAAFLGLAILIITGVLTWDDILKNTGAWDTIVWFAALVMMAGFLGKLGLVSWLATTVGTGIGGLGLSWIPATLLLLLVYVYSHYFFASTTAHITAMFAAFFAAGIALGAPEMLWALVLGFSSSIMMSLTHYGTGTAPIIFGSGYTTLGEWWKVGFVTSVVNLIIFILVGGIWWKILELW
ncbi:divalent anion:Na+ symporter, DASS family [Myroides marinus]|uniref:C4-dicarboxylate ABC transporter n=1 Tax=Myroides marinus TaxID=703342 RepID=A0A164AE93_9FLAO|nr:DASS family sodium-coupled anion symporter [Myroides marinus]KZE83641.1 C4-dicarboxylate ABC transporter [Myroides marinus]MDM1353672.1 DASS family sodium-coupled anion symporter [Myroides marinus]SEI98553.1 divalent anion:Na+ symporter, DASS family [Myroides marinus]